MVGHGYKTRSFHSSSGPKWQGVCQGHLLKVLGLQGRNSYKYQNILRTVYRKYVKKHSSSLWVAEGPAPCRTALQGPGTHSCLQRVPERKGWRCICNRRAVEHPSAHPRAEGLGCACAKYPSSGHLLATGRSARVNEPGVWGGTGPPQL